MSLGVELRFVDVVEAIVVSRRGRRKELDRVVWGPARYRYSTRDPYLIKARKRP